MHGEKYSDAVAINGDELMNILRGFGVKYNKSSEI